MESISKQIHDVYTDELLRIIRYTGLCFPPLIVIAGLATHYGYFSRDAYISDAVFWLMSAVFMMSGVWQFHTTRYGVRMQAINLILFHILGTLFIWFIVGFDNPVIGSWIALAMVADILFGRTALAISLGSLALIGWLHLIRLDDFTEKQILNVSFIIASIAAISIVTSFLRRVSDSERAAYHKYQKQHQLQRERLTTLINAMNDAVISTDSKGIIKLYNAAALNLLDTNKTLSGLSIDTVLNLCNESTVPVSLRKILKQNERIVRRDLLHRYDDGEMINLSISISSFRPTYRQKAPHGFIIVLRDITKEKSLEEERDEFISVVSHELRTPIAITEGNLSNLKYMLSDRSADTVTIQTVTAAHEQVIYLARMINDLSTLSRAERGIADEAEEISVNELIESLFSEYRPQAEAKHLALNLDVRGHIGTVYASKLYLEEILQNFITNAIKYTENGSVTIGAKIINKEQVEFFVSDTGIGISKSDQKHIYDKFYRSEDYRTRETGGTGLGLYVVRKLAQKLDITIHLTSRLNHGSTFRFTMPLAASSVAESMDEATQIVPLTKHA